MNKVIIDGIDVSECKHFGIYKNRITQEVYQFCNKSGENCEELKDCYYKQLQRAKAEYDDLHLSYAGCKTANTGLKELNEKLQAENDNLKDDIDKQQLYMDSLEQENKKLKSNIYPQTNYTTQQFYTKEEYDKLQQENEQIKKDYAKLHIDFAKCNEENEWLEKEVETWIYQADKRAKLSNIRFNTAETYKQALQEIREYCEEQNLKADYTACEILTKINEVIGAE